MFRNCGCNRCCEETVTESGCGCGGGGICGLLGNLFNGGSCCWIILIIILLVLYCN
jgi:hypothetical protein